MRLLLFTLIAFLSINTNLPAQTSGDEVVIELDVNYDEFLNLQYVSKEYYYANIPFSGEIKKDDEKRQISFKPKEASTHTLVSAYHVPEWDDSIIENEAFEVKSEYLNKTVVLQLK